MSQSINLIPQQEVVAQRKTKWIKLSTVMSVLILVIVGGVSAYVFYTTLNLRSDIKEHDTKISSLRTQIQGLSDIEIKARNLDQKYTAIANLLDTRSYYSEMLETLRGQTPEGVEVDTFTFGREGAINLSGSGESYLAISDFIEQLLSTDLFTEVIINSVTLEPSTNRAKFFLLVSYDVEVIKK